MITIGALTIERADSIVQADAILGAVVSVEGLVRFVEIAKRDRLGTHAIIICLEVRSAPGREGLVDRQCVVVDAKLPGANGARFCDN